MWLCSKSIRMNWQFWKKVLQSNNFDVYYQLRNSDFGRIVSDISNIKSVELNMLKVLLLSYAVFAIVSLMINSETTPFSWKEHCSQYFRKQNQCRKKCREQGGKQNDCIVICYIGKGPMPMPTEFLICKSIRNTVHPT